MRARARERASVHASVGWGQGARGGDDVDGRLFVASVAVAIPCASPPAVGEFGVSFAKCKCLTLTLPSVSFDDDTRGVLRVAMFADVRVSTVRWVEVSCVVYVHMKMKALIRLIFSIYS